ncbi:MAG TPA: ion channel, partial [bacterium]
MKPLRNLRVVGLALLGLGLVGTAGFHWIEGWPWLDSLYMVVTTFTTVGYMEIHPLSQAGRVFNLVLILSGVGLVFLGLGTLTQALLEFELEQFFGRRKMERDISRLTGHYILCGAGRVGRAAAAELARKPVPFVMVENSPAKLERLSQEWLTLSGDATQEETLRKARIEQAQG